MDELQESLSRLLENPEELERMSRLAANLLGGEETPDAAEAPALPDLKSLLRGADAPGGSDTQKLLRAMRPFLAPKRQEKLSRAMRAARLASVAQMAFGQMKEEEEDEPILRQHGSA